MYFQDHLHKGSSVATTQYQMKPNDQEWEICYDTNPLVMSKPVDVYSMPNQSML